jgi:hypothetical protein
MKIIGVETGESVGKTCLRMAFTARTDHLPFSRYYRGTNIAIYDREIRFFFNPTSLISKEVTVGLPNFTCFATTALDLIYAKDYASFPLHLLAPVLEIESEYEGEDDYAGEGLLRLSIWNSHEGKFVLACVRNEADQKPFFWVVVTEEDLREMIRLADEAEECLGKEVPVKNDDPFLPEEEIPF